jgi:hypothetical protein
MKQCRSLMARWISTRMNVPLSIMHEAFPAGGFLETSDGRNSFERLCEEKIQRLRTHRLLFTTRRFVKGCPHTSYSENSSGGLCEETLSLFHCSPDHPSVRDTLAYVASRSVPARCIKSV